MKNYKLRFSVLCSVLFLSLTFVLFAQNDPALRYTQNSKLATGKWIKIEVTQNGIYKLSYEEIKQMGIDDPTKVNLHGYGGWILEADFLQYPYLDDLPEVSVWINKGTDGIFGPGDFLLFYARGHIKWEYNSVSDEYVHQNNPYSTSGAYFLTQGSRGPREMEAFVSEVNTVQNITVFDDYALAEKDLTPAAKAHTGRELFGESFIGKNTQDFEFNIPGIIDSEGKLRYTFAASANRVTPLSVYVDGKLISTQSMNTHDPQYTRGVMINKMERWTESKSEKIVVRINYPAANQPFASLNYIRLNMERQLKGYGEDFTFFRSKKSINKATRFEIERAQSNFLIFDVSSNTTPLLVTSTFDQGVLHFGIPASDALREFVLVDPTKSFLKTKLLGEIKNQNLHALSQADMLIIAPAIFLEPAAKLASEHEKRDGLKVHVVDAALIYNEFSSGVSDVTAYRRFMKMFYDRAASESEKPQYLLMFGDSFFDNRFIIPDAKGLNKANFLMSYQVEESLNESNSYGTDDYIGFLDDNEGVRIASDRLDLGIGRFPVRTIEDARNVVDKVIAYMNNANQSAWKNRLLFAADDSDPGGTYCSHALEADQSALIVENVYPDYMVSKVYMDAFKQVLVNGKKTYPDANKKLNEAFKNGILVFNYTGHGSTTALSGENLIDIKAINQMNFPNLPLWITATCDFSWYDGVTTSAGEAVLRHKNSAGIALFSTTRPVTSYNNFMLNKELTTNLFLKKDGKYPRLGDVIRQSKLALNVNANKLNYMLIGDPALRLNYPKSELIVKTINGKELGDETVNFKAMDHIELKGVVLNPLGEIDTEFDGLLYTSLFDSQQEMSSVLARDNKYFTYNDYPYTVFAGTDSVKKGEFTVKFMVPLDISYDANNLGKINFYASNSNTREEAKGSFKNFRFFGTNEDGNISDKGPEILSVYLNTTQFKDGDKVNARPYFVAEVSDINGINIAGSSLGHDLMICIDNNPLWTYSLNNYFVSKPGAIGKGQIYFSIPELPAGSHELVFRVWNLLNISSTKSLNFVVDPSLSPQLFDLRATSNPAKESTSFLLSHDRPETDLELEVFVFDVSGKRVWSTKENIVGAYSEFSPIEWDLRTNQGSRVKPGVYIYRASIKTKNSNEATKSKKIIILGQ